MDARDEAERCGITPIAIDAVTRHDRRLPLYMVGQLGSPDLDHRRSGEFGLRRLIVSMERAA